MKIRMRFKTKSQLIIFIKGEGEEFAELVREAYNDILLLMIEFVGQGCLGTL